MWVKKQNGAQRLKFPMFDLIIHTTETVNVLINMGNRSCCECCEKSMLGYWLYGCEGKWDCPLRGNYYHSWRYRCLKEHHYCEAYQPPGGTNHNLCHIHALTSLGKYGLIRQRALWNNISRQILMPNRGRVGWLVLFDAINDCRDPRGLSETPLGWHNWPCLW